MARATGIFIFLCMVIIAGSVAAMLVFQFARPAGEALSLSLALLCAMVVIHLVFARQRERSEVSEKVAQLEERVMEVDEDIGNLEGRLSGLETSLPRRARDEIDPLFAEVEVLGSLIKQMAEAMAGMEDRIDEQDRKALEAPPPRYVGYEEAPRALGYTQPSEPAHAPHREEPSAPAPRMSAPPLDHGYVDRPHGDHGYPERGLPERDPGEHHRADRAPGPQDHASRAPREAVPPVERTRVRHGTPPARHGRPDLAMRQTIQEALDTSRVDLYLQPMVTLPQRQVRDYEALTRIRDANDTMLEPVDFIEEAVRARLMPAIDNLMLFRAIQVLRRLSSRNRSSGLFVNVSSQTLVDERFFPGFLDFLRGQEGYGEHLTFEFTQRDVADMGALEHESLAALADLGFRFSVDRVTDLRMDFKALADVGFRYVKVHANRLIGGEALQTSHIHPADFSDLLRRFGMELIVDHIETEAQALEVLDLEVRIGQGYLFSPPRPVRPEVLQGRPPRPARRAAE
ncbi:EAL domain-containing protein [Stappia indica]|uniref:EAL domain-containing protein n=1 Tax=Stappia indica TaxID=538381 RepID=UPI001CD5AC06|nr:EAL domain-containing protein [Stappia indica]MCA1297736.1 EAL domain-containing protein [Stappia indica]